ncbi:MAG: hypothetical protein ABI700_21880 [Chloroflexota bacterium]
MRKFFVLIWVVSLLSGLSLVSAQADAPYLYYYSRMLGGLIIEHPDGSDSRLIGSDVIPPNLTGISGPGWSPSGKYFAAYGFIYDAYTPKTKGAYLIDLAGNPVNNFLSNVTTSWMRWLPTDKDLLLVEGTLTPNLSINQPVSFWIVDPSTEQVTADQDGFSAYHTPPKSQDIFVLLDAEEASPSGTYEASGMYPTVLRNRDTGVAVELPNHSQGTICRSYRWSKREDYLITINGTLLAGGGCGSAVIGITDQAGKLWRELGSCSWDEACADWLPSQVAALPPGQPKPIQLDPVAYKPDDFVGTLYGKEIPDIRLRYDEQGLLDVIDGKSQEILYQLEGQNYLDRPNDLIRDRGVQIAFAYDSQHQLLAVYDDGKRYVTLWSMKTSPDKEILRLNTSGFQLEFTPDGTQLRARNTNAWKIYNVSDILAAAGLSE